MPSHRTPRIGISPGAASQDALPLGFRRTASFPMHAYQMPGSEPSHLIPPTWRVTKAWKQVESNQGFDDRSPIPWQLLPIESAENAAFSRKVMAKWYVHDVVEQRIGRKILRFSRAGRELTLSGLAEGCSVLSAYGKRGRHVGDLIVCVKPTRVVQLGFIQIECYQTADSTDPIRKSVRASDHAALLKLTNKANEIIRPQTNVQLRSILPVKVLQVIGDLGRQATIDEVWSTVRKHRNPSADINVVFVWDYEAKERQRGKDVTVGGHIAVKGGPSTNVIVIQDVINDVTQQAGSPVPGGHGKVLAHEVGHWLLHGTDLAGHDRNHHSPWPGDLMHASVETASGLKSGTHIGRVEADAMNPHSVAPERWFTRRAR